jgi:hypothetical protein
MPHLRPGSYRVLRIYRPLKHEDPPAPGWWVNGDVVVRAEAGKEVALPVLERTDRDPPPARPPLPAREAGMHATLQGMQISYARSVDFLQQPQMRVDGNLQLDLAGNGTGIAPDRVYGLGNLIAADDRGNLLNSRGSRSITVTPAQAGRGFTWRATPSLNPPHPLAKKLAWVEGDLLAYRTVAPVRFELPLPLPPGGTRREMDRLHVELDSLAPPPAGEERGIPAAQALLLKGRIRGPRGSRFGPRLGGYPPPVLVGQSGKTYLAGRSADSVGLGLWEIRAYYQIGEPVTAARFDFTLWTDLEPIGSFRLADLPLPPRRASSTRRAVRGWSCRCASESRLPRVGS